MRIAFSTLGRTSIQNVNSALSAVVELRQQVASGRKFDIASQDPIGAQRSIMLTNELANIKQYRDSSEAALLYLESSQGVLLDLGERLREAKSIALQQRNDVSDASTREATAISIRSIRDQMVSLLNTEVGGRHLFGGHQTKADPFAYDANGNVVYNGDEGEITFRIGPSQFEVTNIPGSRVAGTSSTYLLSNNDLTPNVTPSTLLSSLQRGAGIPQGQFLIDNGVGGQATIDTTGMTTVLELMVAINGSGIGVIANSNATGTGLDLLNFFNPTSTLSVTDLNGGDTAQQLGIAGSGVGVIRGLDTRPAINSNTLLSDIPALTTLPPGEIRVVFDSSSTTVDFAAPPAVTTVGELISRFNSTVPQLTMSISPDGTGVRIDGSVPFTIENVVPGTTADQLGIAASGQQARLFGALEDLETALRADDGDGIEQTIAELQLVIDQVVRVQGSVASRLQRLDSGLLLLDTHALNAETRLSGVVATDMAEAITALTQAQTLYQTALGTTATIYDLNLFDYVYR